MIKYILNMKSVLIEIFTTKPKRGHLFIWHGFFNKRIVFFYNASISLEYCLLDSIGIAIQMWVYKEFIDLMFDKSQHLLLACMAHFSTVNSLL